MLKAKVAPCTCTPRTSMVAMELWGPRSVFMLPLSYSILSTEYYNIHVCLYRLMYHQVHVPSYKKKSGQINDVEKQYLLNSLTSSFFLSFFKFYALKELNFRTL